MKPPLLYWTLLVLLSCMSATAQTRDTHPATGTAAIVGIVVSDDVSARPVRKARVICNGPDLPGNTTITDEAGRFAFTGLPAGRYTIGASKPTWVTTSYGARRALRPGTPLPLAEGQRLEIVVRLAPGAVISGVLLDHANQPASGAQVRALRYQMSGGERRLVDAASATTDDRGAYRLFGLAAGDYYVTASTRNLGGMNAGILQLTSDADVRDAVSGESHAQSPSTAVAFAPAFYPNGTSASQASVVSLRAGEERTGVDFALPLVRTARIDGAVALPEGGVPPGTQLTLIATGTSGTPGQPSDNFRGAVPGMDGTFMFVGIPPGIYQLVARASRPMSGLDGTPAPPLMMWAATQIAVDGEPVTGLALSLEPGLTIAGQVVFPRAAVKPPDMKSVRIGAIPVDTQTSVSFAPASVTAGADGRFTLTGVMPGRYRLTATFPGAGRAGTWTVASIVANGADALDAPLTVAPNSHVLDALVTFTDHLAEVSGRVLSASPADYTVVLFPETQNLWQPQSRRIQGARAASDGGYAFRNVPPGSYLVAVTDDVDNGEWFDPAFLQRLVPSASRVVVQGNGTVALDLNGKDR